MCATLTMVVTVFARLVWPAMPQAATASTKITWANEEDFSVLVVEPS